MTASLGWPFYVVLALCGLELVALFISIWIGLDRTKQRDQAREQILLDAEARSIEYSRKPQDRKSFAEV